MNVQTHGAAKRPRLTLHFGGKSERRLEAIEPGSSGLCPHELRRIVATMVD